MGGVPQRDARRRRLQSERTSFMSLRSKIFVLDKSRNQMEIQQAESCRYHPNTTLTGGLAPLTSDGGGPSSLSNERLLSRLLSRCRFFLKRKQKQLLPDFPSSILTLFASDRLLFHSKPSKVAFRAPTPPPHGVFSSTLQSASKTTKSAAAVVAAGVKRGD